MRLRIVDAFTATLPTPDGPLPRPFTGNPAGVVVLDAADPARGRDGQGDVGWMRAVAAELNLSETAFAVPEPGDGTGGETGAGSRFGLRWFTPAVEVDLCGHATLATAHALATDGVPGPYLFSTRSGTLTAEVAADGAVTLDFPAQPPTPVDDGGALGGVLAAALGADVVALAGNGIDLVAEVADEETLRALAPDITALARIDARCVAVTAAAAPRPVAEDVALHHPDVVSRVFGPRVGVAEDPVTGSAHCALGPYWAPRLGRDRFLAHQVSPRGGVLDVQVHGDRVRLTGWAVTVVDGRVRGPQDS